MDMSSTPQLTNWRTRATVTVEQAAPILGIGRSTAYVLARTGEIPTIQLGRRKLVPVARLRAMLGETRNDDEATADDGDLVHNSAAGASHVSDYTE